MSRWSLLWMLQCCLSLGIEVEDVAASVCGIPATLSRIVGGQNAQPGEWPWQISLQRSGIHICGGSLMTNQWVITAAHCFEKPYDASLFTVLMGAYTLSVPTSSEVITGAKQIIVNSNYSGTTGSMGDIALLELQMPVTFTDYILPICIPPASIQIPSGTNCWVTGWGAVSSSGTYLAYPQYLQEVEVPIIASAACQNMFNTHASYSSKSILYDMICAGYPVGGKDSCQGDSGGPLTCQFNTTWVLVGLVSWGEGCALPNMPGVYTRVSTYIDWIIKQTPDVASVILTSLGSQLSATETPTTTTSNTECQPRPLLLLNILFCFTLCYAFIFLL